MGNGHALGGARESGDLGLLSKDPHTHALGCQGAAGTGLRSPLGGESLGHDRPPVRTCKATQRDGPLGGGMPSWQVAVQSLCTVG